MPTAEVEILRAACCVAGVDKQITPAEMAILVKLADRAGVGHASFNAMLDRARNDPTFYKDQFRLARADPTESVRVMVAIAGVDGEITQEERIIVAMLGETIGLAKEKVDEILEAGEVMARKIKEGKKATGGG
jgi:tellurite resistance protein